MGVGAPGQSESICALISMSGCQTSPGMTTGTPLLLRPIAPVGPKALFLDWAPNPGRVEREACRTRAVSPIELRSGHQAQYIVDVLH